ncbi:MAG: PEGA domain-containing protein [Deltaproteobacteria bacterium]|nr:PEGA domain-containing protein [Deltaproteobacteria bacterium]
MSSAAAPMMDELDAADDFLDDETTKIHELPESDYPADADATVIAKEAAAPFIAQQRRTPLVPAASSSPLENAVPDLFGPAVGESFGPAPGEFIDASLLDPEVLTVPPPAATVPVAPGIPAEAFQVPKAATPAWTTRPAEPKRSRAWMFVVLFVLALAAGAGAAWQLGFADDLITLAAPYFGQSTEPVEAPSQLVQPVPAPTHVPGDPSAAAQPEEGVVTAAAAKPTDAEAAPAEEAPVEAADTGMVKFQVLSHPSGAFVSVNGKGVGRAPLELEYEAGTKLSLFSKARGHLARRQKVTVGTEQEAVNLWLAPLPYVVQVVTNPAGARASSVGGGEATTPGALQFKSMSGSRKIVVSKDGYKTASKSLTRADFIEETRRMAATVTLTLQKDGAAEPAPTEAEPPVEPPPSEPKAEAEPPAEPPPSEPKAEPTAPPKAVEEIPAPSETTAADAP